METLLVALRHIPGIGPMFKGVTLKPKSRVLSVYLYTDNQKECVAACPTALEIVLSTQFEILPDRYHLRVKGCNFTQSQVKDPACQRRWALENGWTSLTGVRHTFGIVILSFANKAEAIRACYMSPCLDSQVVTCV